MIKTVFLDLDDTIADFIGGLHKALGVSYEYSNYLYKKGDWNILGHQIVLNDELVTYEQCDACCNMAFWIDLDWMHDGHDILRAVFDKFSVGQIYLLTTPMPNLKSASGKMIWIHNQIPAYPKRTIITQAPKHLLARPDTLLIDDKDENVDGFREAGGKALLVPRPWNRAHLQANRTVEVVKEFLERTCQES